MSGEASGNEESPASTVRALVTALVEGRYPEVFARVDHSDLPRWRRMVMAVIRHCERQPEGSALLREWGAESAAELEMLPDEALFERWLQALSPEARARNAFSPAEAPPHPTIDRVILGDVREGADIAHVVYREIVGRRGAGALRTVTLHRSGGTWKVEIDHDFLIASGLHSGPPPR